MSEPLRVIAYGGGVQSTALLALAAEGKLGRIDAALFANVGERAEHPDALAYVRDVARPFAEAHGFPLVETRYMRKDGTPVDLYERVLDEGAKGGVTSLPVRMSNSGAPGNRTCTADHKIRAMARQLRQMGATKDSPAEILVGISTDEWHRAGRGKDSPHERRVYPLLDLGYSRAACQSIIKAAGLPVPGKSACFFCPFTSVARWAEIRRDDPELFERAASLEDHINEGRAAAGRAEDPVFLCSRLIPLRDAIGAAQETLPGFEDEGECDSGACWT